MNVLELKNQMRLMNFANNIPNVTSSMFLKSAYRPMQMI